MDVLFSAISQIDSSYLIALVLGTIVGYIVGAIPGFSSTMGVALFVPFSYSMNVNVAFAFLLALYSSSIFSGSIPAILIKTPGTPSSVATVFDGYPMAKNGQPGKAIGLACMASIFGGIFSAVMLIFFAGNLAEFALRFGPQEYFALSVMGLSMIVSISEKNVTKGVLSAFIGLAMGLIGMDPITGYPRYTFGNVQMLNGLQDLPVMVGIFAITEILLNLTSVKSSMSGVDNIIREIDSIFSGWRDIVKNWFLMVRCSILGTVVGALPGVGTTTAAIMAYNEAKRTSKTPDLMGTGIPEGIIAPETANNAVSGGAMIPMLALGLPGDSVTAILLGALMIQGLTPGPELFSKYPDTVVFMYLSLILSYLVILFISIFSIRWIIKVIEVPSDILDAFVLTFCIIGAFALRNAYFDIYLALFCGVLGFIMHNHGIPVTPMILGLILGPIIEQKMLVSIQMSKGNWMTFINRPISGTLLVLSLVFIIFSVARSNRRNRENKSE